MAPAFLDFTGGGHYAGSQTAGTVGMPSRSRMFSQPFRGHLIMKSSWARMLCRLLMVLMIWSPMQLAQAGMIGTDQLVTATSGRARSEEHTSELQSRLHLVCRLLLEKKKKQ